MNFTPASGNMLNLPTDENHLNFKWKDGNIFFSVARLGNGASCHFSCDKESKKGVHRAINEFCEFVFWMFDWCEMIIAKVELPSVEKIIIDCGFYSVAVSDDKKYTAYIREKSWVA